MKGRSDHIEIINVQSPNDEMEDEIQNTFLKGLKQVHNSLLKCDIKIAIGSFNVKLGKANIRKTGHKKCNTSQYNWLYLDVIN